MLKKYIISQLTDLSAWIGAIIILSVCFLPDSVTICLGVFLILSSDKWLRERIAEWSPKIKEILAAQDDDR